ncbi:hypothetical protein HQN90_00655 [Paenibacillus alba]|uniref:hypothetical protein n=1 Tax=Paenibacillus alba TaxID=1197127 RepID=UPI001567446B|nr:hypothetical protein [Paenibacillus alba]NQX64625.1 hypothetical protein [Paenibacillus alba]
MSKLIILPDGLEGVLHFFEHGEYEMAFEGLIIELTNVALYPKGFKYSEWFSLALHYKLNVESVFDVNIWFKFKQWGEAHQKNI